MKLLIKIYVFLRKTFDNYLFQTGFFFEIEVVKNIRLILTLVIKTFLELKYHIIIFLKRHLFSI